MNRSVKVIDLSKEFGVTEETIRRDLEKLEQEGVLVRTYGGAVLVKKANEELLLSIRLRENVEGKALIAQIISSLIQEGDVIMLGTGKKVILAVDHTKFNSLSMVSLFDFSNIDIVATDIKPSKEWMDFFDKRGIECLFST